MLDSSQLRIMKNKYHTVIWDVDGTLLDTSEGLMSAARAVIEAAGLAVPTEAVLKTYIGPPIQKSFERTLGLSKDDAMELANKFRARYKEKDLFKAQPYTGIQTLIKKLSAQGVRQAVATYKRQDYAERIVEHFGFSPYMEVVCGSDFAGILTKDDIVANAVQMMGADARAAVMVGDSRSDAQGAQANGLDFLAVTYGFGYPQGARPETAVAVAANVEELSDLLAGE